MLCKRKCVYKIMCNVVVKRRQIHPHTLFVSVFMYTLECGSVWQTFLHTILLHSTPQFPPSFGNNVQTMRRISLADSKKVYART